MEAEVAQFFPRAAGGGGGGDAELPPDGQPLGPCPRCGLPLLLCRRAGETAFIACSGTPVCGTRVYLPNGTLAAEVAEAACSTCQHGAVRMLALRCAAPSPARLLTRRPLASEVLLGCFAQERMGEACDVSMARCARPEACRTQDMQTDVRSSMMCAGAGPCYCRLCDLVMPPAGFGRRCCRSGTMLP